MEGAGCLKGGGEGGGGGGHKNVWMGFRSCISPCIFFPELVGCRQRYTIDGDVLVCIAAVRESKHAWSLLLYRVSWCRYYPNYLKQSTSTLIHVYVIDRLTSARLLIPPQKPRTKATGATGGVVGLPTIAWC